MTAALAQGFDNAVEQAQAAFRAAMNALATPGRVIRYRAPLDADTPLPLNAAALGLALLDFETSYYLAPSLAEDGRVAEYLTFHTGARRATGPSSAAFALLDLAADPLTLSDFAQGTPDYPDRSTTIVALVPAFGAGAGLRIAGPGINGEGTLAIDALPAGFVDQWAANRAAFPLGVDIIFAGPEGLVGLPRSTRILEGGR